MLPQQEESVQKNDGTHRKYRKQINRLGAFPTTTAFDIAGSVTKTDFRVAPCGGKAKLADDP